MTKPSMNRRDLLRYGAVGAGATLFPGVRVLSAGPARASEASGYRALVCVFLNGGVDGFNIVVPRSTREYDTYASARQVLAVPQNQLVPIEPLNPDGAEYGFGPELPEMAARFQQGKLAIVANVGSLVQPLTKNEYLRHTAPAPDYLFSHSDQHNQWFAGGADGRSPSGWCGRIADRLAAAGGAPPVPVCISCTGEAKQLVGAETSPYFLTPDGLENFEGLWKGRLDTAFRRLANDDHAHPMQRRFAEVQRETMDVYDNLSGALELAPDFDGLFPASPLGAQLRTVAQVIAMRAEIGTTRQIFFVDDDGYDTHEDQPFYLPGLLRNVSKSLDAFQSALDSISADDCVTTFTSSEFGRTLTSNGKGCDHGWGNHHLVMGTPVAGRMIHGTMPNLELGGDDDVDEGRILPTQSVDQYAATFSRWFGLSESEIAASFPNLARFDRSDLGFFAG